LQFAVINIYGLFGVISSKGKIPASVISPYEMIPSKVETNDYSGLNEQILSNSSPIQNNEKFKKKLLFLNPTSKRQRTFIANPTIRDSQFCLIPTHKKQSLPYATNNDKQTKFQKFIKHLQAVTETKFQGSA